VEVDRFPPKRASVSNNNEKGKMSSDSDPILLSVLSASCYGAWALLQKLSSKHILPGEVQLCTAATSAFFALSRWLSSQSPKTKSIPVPPSGNNSALGVILAISSGLGSFVGTYYFSQAIAAGGDVGMVSAISATYPAMAYLFSLLLTEGETVQPHKSIGLVFAILSAAAFAYQPPPVDETTTTVTMSGKLVNITTGYYKKNE